MIEAERSTVETDNLNATGKKEALYHEALACMLSLWKTRRVRQRGASYIVSRDVAELTNNSESKR